MTAIPITPKLTPIFEIYLRILFVRWTFWENYSVQYLVVQMQCQIPASDFQASSVCIYISGHCGI